MSDSQGPGTSSAEVEFVLVVEAGPLEAQSLLLIESLRRFGARHSAARVTAVSPRASRRPTRRTLRVLDRLDAEYVPLELSSACPDYPTSWRVHALAAIERRRGPDVLVQLDSDAVFLGDIGPLCVDCDACARPVDVRGMATAGGGDENEPYWSELCRTAGIKLEALPFVQSTVDRATLRATHNGGFVAARRARRLFTRAEEVFRRGVSAGLRPHTGRGLNITAGTGAVGVAGSEWWGAAQAAMAVAATSCGVTIEPLDESINVPIHLWHSLRPKPSEVLHAHYHWLLMAPMPQANPMLDGSVVRSTETMAWLRRRTPLHGHPSQQRARLRSRLTRR